MPFVFADRYDHNATQQHFDYMVESHRKGFYVVGGQGNHPKNLFIFEISQRLMCSGGRGRFCSCLKIYKNVKIVSNYAMYDTNFFRWLIS